MVKLTPEQQRTSIEKAPEVFKPSSGAWGRQGATNVYLPAAKATIVRAALDAAAKNIAPRAKKNRDRDRAVGDANPQAVHVTAATATFEKMRSRKSVEMGLELVSPI